MTVRLYREMMWGLFLGTDTDQVTSRSFTTTDNRMVEIPMSVSHTALDGVALKALSCCVIMRNFLFSHSHLARLDIINESTFYTRHIRYIVPLPISIF